MNLDMSVYKTTMDNLLAQGFNIFVDLGHDNWVPTAEYIAMGWGIPEWLHFMNETVYEYSVYNHTIQVYEVLNEINLEGFWKAPKELYYDLLNQTAHLLQQIKLDNPNATFRISTCGFSGFAKDTIREVFEYGAMEEVDILAFHPYSKRYDTIDEKIAMVDQIAMEYNFDGTYIITEVGAFSDEKDDQIEWMRDQSNEVLKIYTLGLTNPRMEFITYYNCEGFGLTGKTSEQTYNLLFDLLTNTWYCPRGARINGPIGPDQFESHLFYNDSTKTVVLAMWQMQGAELNLRINVPGGIDGTLLIHDIYSGLNHEVAYHALEDGSGDWFDLSLGSDPVVISFKYLGNPAVVQMDINWNPYQVLIYIIYPIGIIMTIAVAVRKRKLKKS